MPPTFAPHESGQRGHTVELVLPETPLGHVSVSGHDLHSDVPIHQQVGGVADLMAR